MSQMSAEDDFQPSLPYAGTAGHSGTDTSRERAEREAEDGSVKKYQRYVMTMAQMMKEKGVTVAELREKNGNLHHGRVSSSLSSLHKEGRLVRLSERRNGCKVYVTPDHVNERASEPYGRRRSTAPTEVLEATERALTGRMHYGDIRLMAEYIRGAQ